MKSARAVAVASAALAVAVSARAAMIDELHECSGLADGDAFATLNAERRHRAFHLHWRIDPARATRIACTQWRTAATATERALALTELATLRLRGTLQSEVDALLDAAFHQLQLTNPGNAAIQGELELVRALARLDRQQNADAVRHLALAQGHLRAAGLQQSALHAQVLTQQARTHRLAMRLGEAAAALDAADVILAAVGLASSHEAADVLNERAERAFLLQDYKGTISLAERQLHMRRAVDGQDTSEALNAFATLGALRDLTGDYSGAEADLREGLRVSAIDPQRQVDAQLVLMSNLAALHLGRLEPALALPVALRGMALAEAYYGTSSAQTFRMLLRVGTAHQQLGRYAEAGTTYERATSIVVALGSHAAPDIHLVLRLIFGRATIALRVNDAEAVHRAVSDARALIGTQDNFGYWLGWGERLECQLATQQRDWQGAQVHCAQAILLLGQALADGADLIFEARINQCLSQAAGGLPGTACAAVQQRIGNVAHPLNRYRALAALAARDEADGDLAAAHALRLEALAVAQGLQLPEPLWSAQASLAALLERQGQRPLAVFFGKLSVNTLESMRRQFATGSSGQEIDRAYLADKFDVYRRLADWLFSEDRFDEALETIRLLKSEEQVEYIERAAAAEPGRPGTTFNAAETRLNSDWSRIVLAPAANASARHEHLTKLSQASRITLHEREELTRLSAEVQARHGNLMSVMKPFFASNFLAQPGFVPQAVRTTVPDWRLKSPGDLLVLLTMADDHVNFVTLSGGSASLRRIEIRPEELAVLIGRHVAAIADNDRSPSAGAVAEALDRLLAQPIDAIARERKAVRLVLVVDGALRYLPFAALRAGNRFLIEKYTITYDTLQSVAPVPHARMEPTRGSEVRALGVTLALAGLPALAGVRTEFCDIVRGPVVGLDDARGECATGNGAFVGAGYANAHFTAERMQKLLADDTSFSMLHIGTHFSLRVGNMKRSWLLLGDGSRLSLDALHRLDFSGVGLVTLSACQTGMAGAVGDDGREVEGLPALLHARGVDAVVASLWRVEDRSTGMLMGAFYRSLRAGANQADALRQAQLGLLDRGGAWRNPLYWAAFKLITAQAMAER